MIEHGGNRWLFLINSANSPATFALTGLPAGVRLENAFDGAPLALDRNTLILSAYGVAALKFAGDKK